MKAGEPYDRTQLDNFTINIQAKEIKKQINNYKEFEINFKEYIYKNGLVDAKNAVLEQYKVEEDKLKTYFKLDDINNTVLKIDINLKTDEIEIIEYN